MRGRPARRLVAAGFAATLALAACGGDDAPDSKAEIADELIAAMKEGAEDSGGAMTIDEDCVRDKINGLSDSDAEAIQRGWNDSEMPDDVSAEGAAAFSSLTECVDIDLGDITIPDVTIPNP